SLIKQFPSPPDFVPHAEEPTSTDQEPFRVEQNNHVKPDEPPPKTDQTPATQELPPQSPPPATNVVPQATPTAVSSPPFTKRPVAPPAAGRPRLVRSEGR